MHCVYSVWITALRVHEGGAVSGSSNKNYQLDLDRQSAVALYLELKKEFDGAYSHK